MRLQEVVRARDQLIVPARSYHCQHWRLDQPAHVGLMLGNEPKAFCKARRHVERCGALEDLDEVVAYLSTAATER